MSTVAGATHFHVATLGAIWNGSMVKVAQVGQHVFYGFGGHRGALDDGAARNSSASDVVAPPAQKAASTPDKPADAPSAPTTVAVSTPVVAPTVTASAS